MTAGRTWVLLVAGCMALWLAAASPTAAQEFEPRSGRSYVVRDLQGKLLERLRPSHESYVRLSLSGQRLGRAVPDDGGRLSFYDTSGALIGTARRDGRRPMALRLRAIAVIRSVEGESLGIVATR